MVQYSFSLLAIVTLGALSADSAFSSALEGCERVVTRASTMDGDGDRDREFGGSENYGNDESWRSSAGDDSSWRGGSGSGGGSNGNFGGYSNDYNDDESEYSVERRKVEADAAREQIKDLREAIAGTRKPDDLLDLRRQLAQALNYLFALTPGADEGRSTELLALMALLETGFSATDPLIQDIRARNPKWENKRKLNPEDAAKLNKLIQDFPAAFYEIRALMSIEFGLKLYSNFTSHVSTDDKDLFEAGVALTQASLQLAINDLGVSGDVLGQVMASTVKDPLMIDLKSTLESLGQLSEVPWSVRVPNLRNFSKTLDLEFATNATLMTMTQLKDDEGRKRFLRSLQAPIVLRLQRLKQEGAQGLQTRALRAEKGREMKEILKQSDVLISQGQLASARILLVQVDQYSREYQISPPAEFFRIQSRFIDAVEWSNSVRLSDVPAESSAELSEYWVALFYLMSANEVMAAPAESEGARKFQETYMEFLIGEAREHLSKVIVGTPSDSWQRKVAFDLGNIVMAIFKVRQVQGQPPIGLFEKIKERASNWMEPLPLLPSGPKDLRQLLKAQVVILKARYKY